MIPTATAANAVDLMEGWWRACSHAAVGMPQEHAREWMELISRVVRYYRLIRRSRRLRLRQHYKNLCHDALVRSRWELMLLSVYGYVPRFQLDVLEGMQQRLEAALENA